MAEVYGWNAATIHAHNWVFRLSCEWEVIQAVRYHISWLGPFTDAWLRGPSQYWYALHHSYNMHITKACIVAGGITVVSRVSTHGRSTITPDFQRSGRLPCVKIEVGGGYCSTYACVYIVWKWHACRFEHMHAFQRWPRSISRLLV